MTAKQRQQAQTLGQAVNFQIMYLGNFASGQAVNACYTFQVLWVSSLVQTHSFYNLPGQKLPFPSEYIFSVPSPMFLSPFVMVQETCIFVLVPPAKTLQGRFISLLKPKFTQLLHSCMLMSPTCNHQSFFHQFIRSSFFLCHLVPIPNHL